MKVNNSPSSLHLFKQQGILYVTPDPERPNLDLEEIAIECEAEDVTKETNEEGQEVIKVSSGFLLAKAKKKKKCFVLRYHHFGPNAATMIIFILKREKTQF